MDWKGTDPVGQQTCQEVDGSYHWRKVVHDELADLPNWQIDGPEVLVGCGMGDV